MKKLLIGACVVAFAAFGNTSKAQTLSVGVKGGLSLTAVSNLKGKERTTGHAGVYVNMGMNDKWNIQPELLYSAQGQHYTNLTDERRVLALDYVQLPVMIQYHPVRMFYVELGPQVGVMVNGETKAASDGSNKNNVKDAYRRADLGINGGLGLNVSKNFGVYARYTQGVMNISKTAGEYRNNTALQLGATVGF